MSRGTQRSSLSGLRGPGEAVPLAAAALVPCLPFLPGLLTGETLWFRDFSLYFVPMKALLVELLRSGELPLWDPYVRNGLPFLANPQTGVFYPPSLLLVVFGLNPGLTLFILLHLAVTGAGGYRLLRAVQFAAPAALFGAIAFGLSGYLMSLVNVLNNLQAVAWVPWMLLFGVRLAERPGWGPWLGLVAAAALSILGGELQLTALALGLAAAMAAVLGVPSELVPSAALRARVRAAALVALAGLATTALTAIQLVPTAELVGASVRRLGFPFALAADESLEPSALLSLAFPRPVVPGDPVQGAVAADAVPWLLSTYAGVAVMWLAALGVGGRRAWAALWCTAAVTGIVLALGAHTVVFRWLYEIVPPLRTVRYPQKFLLLTALGIAALAAAGVERLLARDVSLRAVVAGGLIVLASAAGALRWLGEPARGPAGPALLAAGLSAAVVVVVLVRSRWGGLDPRQGALLLCVVAALDLGTWARAINPTIEWRFYDESWAAEVLARTGDDPAGFRVRSSPLAADMEELAVVRRAHLFSNHYLFQHSMAPNLGQLYGFSAQDGLAPIETRGTADLIDELVGRDPAEGLRLLRLLGVKYLVTSFALPPAKVEEVATHPELPVSVVRLRDPLPRAYVVGSWDVVAEPRTALERALSPGFVPEQLVVLDRPPDVHDPSGVQNGGSPGVVRRAAWRPSSASLEVELDRPGILVVTDSHFPGWRATLDGRPAPLLVANGYQRAVAVPPGAHTVDLRYRPASLALGAAVSATAAAVLAGAFLLSRRRSSRALSEVVPL